MENGVEPLIKLEPLESTSTGTLPPSHVSQTYLAVSSSAGSTFGCSTAARYYLHTALRSLAHVAFV